MTTDLPIGDPPPPSTEPFQLPAWASSMTLGHAMSGGICIEWLSDSHDCETCGWTSASGARVRLGGELLLELEPVAHCFGGENWDEGDVYKLILEKIGFPVVEEGFGGEL